MNRRETVSRFRERLTEVIARSGLSRSAFAARAGLDRSTLSQLLSGGTDRLPRAETLAAIASREQVSLDWLLGLSQEDKAGAKVLTESMEIETGAGSPADERLARWHAEAAGYKIRYVPASLPDLLKTEEVIRFEFEEQPRGATETRIEQSEARLEYSRRPETDLEACSSFQSVEAFARGQGVWRDLSYEDRAAQLRRMITLLDELYPAFRWFLFDGRQSFSVPYTIFGPTRGAVYIGSIYFVFNLTEHIRVLTRHFDALIRAAVIQPPDVKTYLQGLVEELEGGPG
jgi:transcriptional regulator with XRE-family HTH domain